VKILIDAQLPPGLKVLLARAGHDSYHVTDIGLRDAADSVVWEYAVREKAIILTKDEDFAARRLRARDGPTIIWLRVGNSSRAALAHWLMPLLPSIQNLVDGGESIIEIRR
jgi:predicted nuclease of predicted toxin-antitoxin system